MLLITARVSRRGVVFKLPQSHYKPSSVFSWNVKREFARYSQKNRTGEQWMASGLSLEYPIRTRSYATAAAEKKVKSTGKPKAKTTKAKTTRKSATGTKKPKVKKAKKKAPKKPKKKAVKKVLTKEQEVLKLRRQLKKDALSTPKGLPSSAFGALLSEIGKEQGILAGAAASARYKAFTPEQMEKYNQIAHENRRKNEENYSNWVASHSVEEIKKANRARTRLRRMKRSEGNKKVAAPYRIKDNRVPKKPISGFFLFAAEKRSAGDFDNIAAKDAIRLAGKEWRELADSEKRRYSKPA